MASASGSQEEILHSELTDLVPVGEGGYGVIYRAKHARFGTVAYKELKAVIINDRDLEALKKEARMHILRHVNIVAFLAIIFETGHYGIVMEYVNRGSLEDFIFKYDVEWPWKLSFAHDIVRGMKYLHSLQPPVIHSDLKPENVLVSETDTFVAKICDFGLAKWTQVATQTTTETRRGTFAYMAPEVHKDPSVSRTPAYDVYAFGILLWELLSEEKPFGDVSNEAIKAAAMKGTRPPLNAIKGNAALVSFAKKWIPRCWHKSPSKRPTFDDLERPFDEIRQIEAAKSVYRPFLLRQPKLAWTQRFDYEVTGVTVLDNIMYVVCNESSTIRLYNTDTHSPLDVVINVDGMKHPQDIVVCRDDRQLYVADWPYCIWRVSVSDRSYVKWVSTESTADRFDVDALSVTSRRLLVTSSWWPSRRLRQYSTTDGQLLRVVELPQYVEYVFHGVETTRGTFVVSHHGTSQHKRQDAVSEVDVTGRLLRTFTDVNVPCHLSLYSEGRVLVADYYNDHILLLNNELQLQRVLIDRNSQVKLWRPSRLCYDELTSRLYVAHRSDSQRSMWSRPDVISSFHLR